MSTQDADAAPHRPLPRTRRPMYSAAGLASSRSPTKANIANRSARSSGFTLSTRGFPGNIPATRRTVFSLTAQTSHCSCVRIRSGRIRPTEWRRGHTGSPPAPSPGHRSPRWSPREGGDSPSTLVTRRPLGDSRTRGSRRRVHALGQRTHQLGERRQQAHDPHRQDLAPDTLRRGRSGRPARQPRGRPGAGLRCPPRASSRSGTHRPSGHGRPRCTAGDVDDPVILDACLGIQ